MPMHWAPSTSGWAGSDALVSRRWFYDFATRRGYPPVTRILTGPLRHLDRRHRGPVPQRNEAQVQPRTSLRSAPATRHCKVYTRRSRS